MVAVIVMMQPSAFYSFAEKPEDVLTMDKYRFTTEYLKFADDSRLSDVYDIKYKFLDTAELAFDWKFPYADDLFRQNPAEFSLTHAKAGLGLALSAFRSTKETAPPQYRKYLGDAGFTNLYEFGYDRETSEDSLSGIIGMKKIDDFTLIAAVTCGQGYQKEWAGNFVLGEGVRHEGFDTAASKLEGYIADFTKENNIEGKKKLWLGGISRAGAIANIAAADAIESGEYEDVYAYLFGVPRTTKEPLNYEGIYNINGEYDPVADMPLETWGYERFGMDLYTPSQESTPGYAELAYAASEVGKKLDGKRFRNNPEVNYQIRLILEWMNEFFDGSDDFNRRMTPLIKEAVLRNDDKQAADVLSSSIASLSPKNDIEKNSIRVAIDYISYVVAQHTRASQRQIDDGSWDPDESIAANFVIEHRGSTYIKWLFNDKDPSKILTAGGDSRRISIIGNAVVSAYHDGVGISRIDVSGNVTAPDDITHEPDNAEHGVFMMRNGSVTIVSLPDTDEYTLVIEPARIGSISYYGIVVSENKLVSSTGRMHVFNLRPGKYSMEVKPDRELPGLRDSEGDLRRGSVQDYKYSPTLVMSSELDATKYTHMSLSTAYNFISVVINILIVLLLICIIIFFVHRRKRKKGHPPYSDMYVIIPHLIYITTFAVMTQFVSYYLNPVGGARAQCAAITVFFIFLLALRGAIRTMDARRIGLSMGLLVLSYLTDVYYNKLPIGSFSKLNMAIFFTIVAGLSALAVRMFSKTDEDNPPKSEEA